MALGEKSEKWFHDFISSLNLENDFQTVFD